MASLEPPRACLVTSVTRDNRQTSSAAASAVSPKLVIDLPWADDPPRRIFPLNERPATVDGAAVRRSVCGPRRSRCAGDSTTRSEAVYVACLFRWSTRLPTSGGVVTMGRRFRYALTATLLIFGLVLPRANASADVTPPNVTLAEAMFVKVGSTLDQDYLQSIPANVTWKASDPSGICQQQMSITKYYTDGSDDGDDQGEFESPVLSSSARQVTLQVGLAYYEYQVTLIVTDCAGNSTRLRDYYYPGLLEPEYWVGDRITLSGKWGTSYCKCWTNGNVLSSDSVGARARYEMYPGSQSFSLLSNRAPNRGVAKVYVDGTFKRRVDLSGTKQNRVVVYHQRWNDFSDHVVDIEVVSGRVDIDGFVSIE